MVRYLKKEAQCIWSYSTEGLGNKSEYLFFSCCHNLCNYLSLHLFYVFFSFDFFSFFTFENLTFWKENLTFFKENLTFLKEKSDVFESKIWRFWKRSLTFLNWKTDVSERTIMLQNLVRNYTHFWIGLDAHKFSKELCYKIQ